MALARPQVLMSEGKMAGSGLQTLGKLPTLNEDGSVGGAYATGGGGAAPNYSGQINSSYDINRNLYNAQLGQIDPQMQTAQSGVERQYGNQIGALTDQRDSAYRNLDLQTSRLNDNYGRNLGQLGNQVRNVLQGQQNALGIQGGGDSSATFMVGHALANQQNQARGDMAHDLNDQLTQIGVNRDEYDTGFKHQKTALDDWKMSQFQGIAQQYNQLKDQIMERLAGNEQARLQALSQAGAWTQAQADAVNRTVGDYTNQITNGWKAAAAPQVGFQNINPYQARNIVTPQVSAGQALQRQVNPGQAMQAFLPPERRDDQFGF